MFSMCEVLVQALALEVRKRCLKLGGRKGRAGGEGGRGRVGRERDPVSK